jgi:cytochrome c biogenesis protein CcmG/thiol:disulfide interchange protein DsbE
MGNDNGISRRSTFVILMGLLVLAGIVTCLIIAGVQGVHIPSQQGGAANPDVAPREGYLAPDFTLDDLAGVKASLSDFRGRPVMINFWASWCPPCRAEMPDIVAAYGQHKDKGFVVLGINEGESVEYVRPFADDFKMTFPVLLDKDGKVADLYRVRGLPTSFFVDRNGVIVSIFYGPMTGESLEYQLRKIQ